MSHSLGMCHAIEFPSTRNRSTHKCFFLWAILHSRFDLKPVSRSASQKNVGDLTVLEKANVHDQHLDHTTYNHIRVGTILADLTSWHLCCKWQMHDTCSLNIYVCRNNYCCRGTCKCPPPVLLANSEVLYKMVDNVLRLYYHAHGALHWKHNVLFTNLNLKHSNYNSEFFN